MGNYRSLGSAAKVNLALSQLPSFSGLKNGNEQLSGRIHIGPDIVTSNLIRFGEYGYFSTRGPTDSHSLLTDPAGAWRRACHVDTCAVRAI